MQCKERSRCGLGLCVGKLSENVDSFILPNIPYKEDIANQNTRKPWKLVVALIVLTTLFVMT